MTERRFNPAYMDKLDDPERKKILPLEKTLSLLEISGKQQILDLGAGVGYFTIPAAQKTDGTVYALDIERKMLEVLQQRVTANGLKNVECIEGPIEQVPMKDESVDHIIASMVLHEINPLAKGLEEIKRLLKPGGKCLCMEWEKVKTEQGPPLHHRISSDFLKKKLEQKGFKNVNVSFPAEAVYTIVFEK